MQATGHWAFNTCLLLSAIAICRAAVQAFCGGISCGVGGNISLAVGPMGRQADANVRLGKSGAALCYSYSCSKGIYAGELRTVMSHTWQPE